MAKNIFLLFFGMFITLSARPNTVDSLEALVAASDDDSLRMVWHNELRKVLIYENPDRALGHAEQFFLFAQKIESPHHIALAKVYIGNIKVQREDYQAALNLFLDAIRYFETEENLRGMAGTYNSIAAAYENMGRDSLTEVYFHKSLKTSEAAERWYSVAIALNNLSNVAHRRGAFADAENYIRRALIELEKTPGRVAEFKPMFLANLSNCLIEQGRFPEADSICQVILEAPALNKYFLAVAKLNYGKSLVKQKKITAALGNLKSAEQLIEENQFNNLRTDMLLFLSEAYEEKNQPALALKYLKEYQTLNDSIFNQEKAKALASALQEYEAEKKDQQIKLLASENQLQEIKLENNKKQKWAMLAGIAALLLIIGLALHNGRIRAKANTALRSKNKIIENTLEEKELLLKEIHHRVKNNLQIITSLLRLKSHYVEDENALQVLSDSRNRLRSMSLLHERLYQHDVLTTIDASAYFDDLTKELVQSYQNTEKDIRVVQNIEPLKLDIETLIPLGLIATELMTNALKHAFAGQEKGIIDVSLLQKNEKIQLKVKDNGAATQPAQAEPGKGFGSRMVQVFADKMEAELTIRRQGGYAVELVFDGK